MAAVQPLAVLEHLDVIEDLGARLLTVVKALMMSLEKNKGAKVVVIA